MLLYLFLFFIKHVSRGTLAKAEKFKNKKNEPIWLVFIAADELSARDFKPYTRSNTVAIP